VETAVEMMGEGGDTTNGEKTKSLPPWLSKVPVPYGTALDSSRAGQITGVGDPDSDLGSDPHHFAGFVSRSGSASSKGCQSGSVSIPSTCIFLFFSEKFQYAVKNTVLKIVTHLPLIRKEKHCEIGIALNKKKFALLSKMCKTLGRIHMRISIGFMPIRIRIWIWIGIITLLKVRSG
jgi:hypothetical protein